MVEQILNKINNLTFVGLGYVVKPSDLNFDEYLSHCFINQTISLLPDLGGVAVHNVVIPSYLIQQIRFPSEDRDLGSLVVYVLHPTQKIPIVVAVLDKVGQENALEYKEFKFSHTKENNSVTISGRGDRGNLLISVESEEEGGGNIDIVINHFNDTGKFSLEVRGDAILLSKTLSLSVKEEIKIKSKSLLLENEKTQIQSDLIELGKDKLEKAVKGERLVSDILSPLLDILSTLTVTVVGSTGTITPTIPPQLKALKAKLQTTLSNKLKIE